MNSEFEKKLMEQPLRRVPAEWRAQILREARIAAVPPPVAETGWRSWLWPAPKAWAALAVCWLVLFAVNSISRPAPVALAVRSDAQAMQMALAEKRRALQDVDVLVAAHRDPPAPPRLPRGSSGWLRPEKGALSC
jgi:hypothetical protein